MEAPLQTPGREAGHVKPWFGSWCSLDSSRRLEQKRDPGRDNPAFGMEGERNVDPAQEPLARPALLCPWARRLAFCSLLLCTVTCLTTHTDSLRMAFKSPAVGHPLVLTGGVTEESDSLQS